MKAMGKRSISSFLMMLFDAGRLLMAVVLALAIVAAVVGAGFAPSWSPTGEPNVVTGLTMSIPVSFTVDRTLGVRAPSLGVDRAEIVDVRGSLKYPVRRGAFFVANAVILVVMIGLAM